MGSVIAKILELKKNQLFFSGFTQYFATITVIILELHKGLIGLGSTEPRHFCWGCVIYGLHK